MPISRIPSVDVCLHRSLRWIPLVHGAHANGVFKQGKALPIADNLHFKQGDWKRRDSAVATWRGLDGKFLRCASPGAGFVLVRRRLGWHRRACT